MHSVAACIIKVWHSVTILFCIDPVLPHTSELDHDSVVAPEEAADEDEYMVSNSYRLLSVCMHHITH